MIESRADPQIVRALPTASVLADAPTRTTERHDIGALTELLNEGNYFFRQANETVGIDPEKARDLYGKAIMRYEKLVRDGAIRNGRLYYNIGNAYFRMEDIGRAILNYRRAEPYIPDDPNLKQNLEVARKKRLDNVELEQKTKVLNTLFFWHYDISAGTRSALFALCFVAAWAMAAVRLFRRPAWTTWGLTLSGALACLLLGSLLVETWLLRVDRPGVIVVHAVIARKGDSETYERSFTEPLHAGTEFELLETRNEWRHIQLADGRQCWIPADSVEQVR